MSEESTELSGPDFCEGVPVSAVADGAMLLGHAQGEPIILARRGARWLSGHFCAPCMKITTSSFTST